MGFQAIGAAAQLCVGSSSGLGIKVSKGFGSDHGITRR
jgi:hypothetical protein